MIEGQQEHREAEARRALSIVQTCGDLIASIHHAVDLLDSTYGKDLSNMPHPNGGLFKAHAGSLISELYHLKHRAGLYAMLQHADLEDDFRQEIERLAL